MNTFILFPWRPLYLYSCATSSGCDWRKRCTAAFEQNTEAQTSFSLLKITICDRPLYIVWRWSCSVKCHLWQKAEGRNTHTERHTHTQHHMTRVKQFLRKRRVLAGISWTRSDRGNKDLKVNWPAFPLSPWIWIDWIDPPYCMCKLWQRVWRTQRVSGCWIKHRSPAWHVFR